MPVNQHNDTLGFEGARDSLDGIAAEGDAHSYRGKHIRTHAATKAYDKVLTDFFVPQADANELSGRSRDRVFPLVKGIQMSIAQAERNE
ncbi:MAG: hypothetical protein ACR2NZ_08280 [Rubripirellula sp.]